MGFRAKGTVNLEVTITNQGTNQETTIWKLTLSPARSSSVTVEKKKGILFLETPGLHAGGPTLISWPIPASVLSIDTMFEVPVALQSILIAAASESRCVEIEIRSPEETIIVGVLLPATDR